MAVRPMEGAPYPAPKKDSRIGRRGFIKGIVGTAILGAIGGGVASEYFDKSDHTPEESFSPSQNVVSQQQEPEVTKEESNELRPQPLVDKDKKPAIEYDFSSTVPQSDKDAIEEGANRALDFFHKELGVYHKGPTMRYKVVYDTSGAGFTATTDGTSISINAGDRGWQQRNNPQKQAVVIHENFHSLHDAITRKGLNRAASGDLAMTEGIAEYSGWKGIIDGGLMTQEQVYNQMMDWVKTGPKLPPTAEISLSMPGVSFGKAFPLYFLLVDRLVGDRGVKALGEYLNNVYNMDWKEAFVKTFNKPIDEFYAESDKWRKDNGLL